MHRPFESAASWVQRVSAPMISDGKCDFSEIDPVEPILRLRLGVYWLPDDADGMASSQSGRMSCHEGAAAYLVSICEKSPAAYDLLRSVCADFICRGEPLSESLRLFTVLYLAGKIDAPKRKRAHKTAFRGIWLYTWARTAASDYGLTLTRNDDTTEKYSACDAVVEGLSRNGHHIGYRAVKEICVGTTSKKIRAVSDEWVKAQRSAQEAGIIPKVVLDRTWYGV